MIEAGSQQKSGKLNPPLNSSANATTAYAMSKSNQRFKMSPILSFLCVAVMVELYVLIWQYFGRIWHWILK